MHGLHFAPHPCWCGVLEHRTPSVLCPRPFDLFSFCLEDMYVTEAELAQSSRSTLLWAVSLLLKCLLLVGRPRISLFRHNF